MRKSNQSSKLKKKRISEGSDAGPADRISNLPESIIAYILSFLPTKDAVATSLLSKSWRLHWNKVTSFDFDGGPAPYERELRRGDVLKMNFVEFVSMVLMSHRADFINKFRLRWVSGDLPSSYLKIWANSAIARNVQVLDLAVLCRRLHELPCALCTCRTLEVLRLQGPILVRVPHVVCLPKLAVLELSSVRYESDECFRKLISACPVLQSLKFRTPGSLAKNDRMVVCTISSPVLKRLQIYSDYVCVVKNNNVKLVIDTPALEYLLLNLSACREISIQGQSSVNEVDLHIPRRSRADSDYVNMIVELVQGFDHAKYMTLSRGTFYALSEATNQLSGNFERLTKLVITLDREWNFLMELIDGCMKLQVLDIAKYKYYWPPRKIQSADWRDPVRVPRCLLSSLRQVSFGDFHGTEDEIAMLKYILEHALVMERVCLSFCHAEGPHCIEADLSSAPPDVLLGRFKKKFLVLNEVSTLSRASTTCKISREESCETGI